MFDHKGSLLIQALIAFLITMIITQLCICGSQLVQKVMRFDNQKDDEILHEIYK